jgi:hypothetical protein
MKQRARPYLTSLLLYVGSTIEDMDPRHKIQGSSVAIDVCGKKLVIDSAEWRSDFRHAFHFNLFPACPFHST